MIRLFCRLALWFLFTLFVPFAVVTPPILAQYEPQFVDTGVVGLGLAVRRLSTASSLLYVTAHPDDEDNGLLARLSRGEGRRVGTLTLTRGEGGQNEIGSELFDALGVLRSEELLAVHRLDGVEQFFGSVVDFGYSFSVEETFEKWDREATVGDIVRVLRSFRPDLVVTLRPEGRGGGQHHQASALLTHEAFTAAADSSRFPEQLQQEGLRPWQAKKLYHAHWQVALEDEKRVVHVATGGFDPLLGMSYSEFGALARNSHRCQGMNAPPEPGEQSRAYSLARTLVPAPALGELFMGLPTTLSDRLRPVLQSVDGADGGEALASQAAAIKQAFAAGQLAIVPALTMRGLSEVRQLIQVVAGWQVDSAEQRQKKGDVLFLLREEAADWEDAARKAHQLLADATVIDSDGLVVPGEDLLVEARLVNRGPAAIRIKEVKIEAPPGWKAMLVKPSLNELSHNATTTVRFLVSVARDAKPTEPFFRRADVHENRYRSAVPSDLVFRPFAPPPLHVNWTYESARVAANIRSPVVYRWYDPQVARRRSYAVKVVPPLNVRMSPERSVVSLLSGEQTRDVEVHIESHVPAEGVEVRLEAPRGWRTDPESVTVNLEQANEIETLTFQLYPSSSLEPGEYEVRAYARWRGETYRRGYKPIAYHHVEARHYYQQARTRFQVIEVRAPRNWIVGYVMGVGDEVPKAITELGMDVKFLGPRELATGDLSEFNVIVTGVRAYKDRNDLIAHNQRLLEYVHNSGVLIVQYNKYELNRAAYGPFPYRIERPHDRVTDENSAVRILDPTHAVFHRPNRISAADWQGWVQERGLYFWREWDSRYTPLLELTDSFPFNPGPKTGALVIARYGQGHYVYTGLSFFRQLPAGVPGAYRLWANLLSLQSTLP